MHLEFLERKDFWAGLMLIVIGGVAIFIARDYPFGTSLRMGPGYFPIVLGALLILFGISIVAKGQRGDPETIKGPWLPRVLVVVPLMLVLIGISLNSHVSFGLAAVAIAFGAAYVILKLRRGDAIATSAATRALVMLPLSLVLFGLLIDRAGFVPALMALIVGSAAASSQFRLIEVLVFATVLTAICAAVFVWALGLPYELIHNAW